VFHELFHDQNFSSVNCNCDRNNQDHAEHHLLRENINTDKRHSHAHNGDDGKEKADFE
jgi:hypothetical protein